MFKIISLFLAFNLIFAVAPVFSETLTSDNDRPSYSLPDSIVLKIVEKAKSFGKSVRMSASIESKIGDLKDVRVFFNSSNDLKIISETRNIKNLKLGSKQVINIIAVKMEDNPGNLGSWIRMGVKYTPDYDELLKTVSDQNLYPEKHLRAILINDLKNSMSENEPYLEAIRHFIK